MKGALPQTRGRRPGVSVVSIIPYPPPAEPVVMAVSAVIPEMVQTACPACAASHQLFRGLDFDGSPSDGWRCTEAGGYACDCGVRLDIRFTTTPTSSG